MKYKHLCKQCLKEFNTEKPKSSFCSHSCRIKFYNQVKAKGEEIKSAISNEECVVIDEVEVELKPSKLPKTNEFIPNWKRIGLGSVEEAFIHILGKLKKNEKRILHKGYDNELAFEMGGYKVICKRK